MNLFKRLTALFLTVVLIAGLLPVGALAAEQEEIHLEFTHINPRYEGILTEADLLIPSGNRIQTYAASDYVTIEEAGLLARPLMKERVETFSFHMQLTDGTEEYIREVSNEIFDIAQAHTGVPTEGDYLAWQYGGWHLSVDGSVSGGIYDLTLTYTLPYYTTAAEEQQVDTAVANLLSDLNLSGRGDYEKVKAVYDYICTNVRYDNDHLNDESYKHQFTAYAALFDGTAVCQGYSVLLYRLALELGIDCRFISGLGNGGAHGWNIIELDNLYYNADSTWDEGRTTYSWFLKCPANFTQHTRDEEYDTDAFHSAYPMASADYVPSSAGTETPSGIAITNENFPDANFRAYLLDQDYGADAVLTEEEIAVITAIYVDEMSISSLDGIEYFTELTGLYCNGNELTSLDVSKNTKLTGLFCYDNLLTSLDVSNNTKLVEFFCQENQITALDISKNTALQYSSFDNNALTSLTIGNQPSLLSIACSFNNLEELDTSKASALKFLGCAYNNLTTLDVTANTALTELECSNNLLTSLDLSRNTAITKLYCDYNTYPITLNNRNQFDLSTLPGNFDVSKASSWNGGSVSGNILTAEKETVSYSYDLGNGNTAIFTLKGTLSEIHAHQYTAVVTDPTCTAQGYTTYTCSCGDTYTADYVDATGHSYGSWYQTKAPTETSTGLEQRDCGKCDHFETRVIEKLEPSDPYSGTCGDNLTWNFNETSGKLSVSGSGDMYGADKLGWTAFAGDIRSVEIGNGATSVGAYAFSDCTNLADVQMPDTVMNIAYNAFENCSSLKTVDIPENVMEISYGAFMDCSGLASVELPQNVMSISYHAFDNCTSLAAVDFPASLSSIQDEAFGSCSGLDELRFTGNAPEIQSTAFLKVTADAYYPASNTTWTEAVRQNYGGTLTWIAEGGTVTPDNSCGENITWSFEEATGTLTISGTEPMARSNGSSIMDDYARPEDTPWFEYQDQILTVVIEATVDSVGKNAFAGCSNLTTVIIEEGVSEIDATAFSDCQSLENCYFEGTKEQWEDLGADVGEVPVHTESAEPATHTETKTTVAPTCTEQGYDLYTCSCGTTRKDNFKDPTGHSYTAVVTEPTCTEKGFTTYTCTCGDTYTGDEVAALGHSWDEGTVIKEPTKEETGTRKYTCTVCEETMEETIAKLGAVQRISGSSRVKTALSVAAALKDTLGVEKFDAVIIAAGDNEKFADALAGSYLANVKGAPILLYTASGMSDLNVQFIQENLSEDGTIYLLGGANSIPDAATEKLADYKVERIAGSSRYTTNLAILKMAGVGNKEILVATGKNFADSLSISAAGLPILLIDGNASALRAEQIEFLEGLKGNKVTIIGGSNSVSVEMEDAIEKVISAEVDRVSGNSRQMTSVEFAERYFNAPELAMITYSDNFPDGLAGGPLAYAMGAPLLLTKEGKEAAAAEYIAENGIASGYVLGGTSSISDATARKVFGLSDEAVITVK